MITISTHSDVAEAIRVYSVGLNKTLEQVTNRTLGQICFTAAKHTRRMSKMWPVRDIDEPIMVTKRGKVRKKSKSAAYMRRLWGVMSPSEAAVRAGLRHKKMKLTHKNLGTVESSSRLFYALARKKNPGAKLGDLSKAARREWSKRHYASGYTALSWTPAVSAIDPRLASRMRGGQSEKWNPATKTARGKQPPAGATLATPAKISAVGVNASPAISFIDGGSVTRAISDVRQDMSAFALKKLNDLSSRAWKARALKMIK